MTDSLKERLARGNETMVEALVAITHLESEVEAWAKQTNKELDCNEHLRATIATLQGKLDRAIEEIEWWKRGYNFPVPEKRKSEKSPPTEAAEQQQGDERHPSEAVWEDGTIVSEPSPYPPTKAVPMGDWHDVIQSGQHLAGPSPQADAGEIVKELEFYDDPGDTICARAASLIERLQRYEKVHPQLQATIERQAADLACKEIAFDRQAETLRLSLKNEADLEAEIERLHSLINETHQKCSAEQDPHHSQ